MSRAVAFTRVESSRDEFIPAIIEMTSPVYMTGETRRVEISSWDEISSREEMDLTSFNATEPWRSFCLEEERHALNAICRYDTTLTL